MKHTAKKMAKDELTAKKSGSTKDFLDVTGLIRSIQRAEGNIDCFRKAQGYCDQLDCNWRRYCLEEVNAFDMNGSETRKDE